MRFFNNPLISAVADAAMEARILGPKMTKQGYSKGYSASVIALASLITATIPPSIGLILYGYVGEVSIGRLFLAGVVPGLFFESAILVLLLTPIFVPIIEQIGFDPVHFGILMMTIVTLGSMTPPVGVAMFTVCSIMDVRIEDYIKESMPFIAAILILVAFLLITPDIVLFLPRLAFGG